VPRQNYLRSRRLRIFAGPNGSGKSTILHQIASKYRIGHYLNADEIEKELKTTRHIDLSNYGISNFTDAIFQDLMRSHSLLKKAKREGHAIDLYVDDHKIINPDKGSHSYEAAFIADILRNELLKKGKKFAFETVMSHKSKIDFITKSKMEGYKTYLYFIATDELNKESNLEGIPSRKKKSIAGTLIL